MSLHKGQLYSNGDVSIGKSDVDAIGRAIQGSDVAQAARHWLHIAESEAIYYFSIYWRATLVGAILLHNIDQGSKTSLVAYHLFDHAHRGLGIGTAALSLLQQFVIEKTNLDRLIVITSHDNLASQRIAQKCGFVYAGAPREDPENGMLFEWDVSVRSQVKD
jgi:RimJ/RimL family protein N-acetyltransferase